MTKILDEIKTFVFSDFLNAERSFTRFTLHFYDTYTILFRIMTASACLVKTYHWVTTYIYTHVTRSPVFYNLDVLGT